MAKSKQKTHDYCRHNNTNYKWNFNEKVFKKKKNGTLTYMKSGSNHKTGKDTAKAVRQRRNKGTLAKGDSSRLKSVI